MNPAYPTYLLTLIALFFVLGASFNLLVGFTGLSNLGQPGLILLGAYTTALLQVKLGIHPALALAAGAGCGALGGLLLSLITRRARGDIVAVMGMWFMFILVVLSLNWISLTRGALGIPGIPRPTLFAAPERFLLLILLAAAVVYGLLHHLTRSPFGRVLGAVRDDELAAATLGKNVFKARLIAFALSGAIAGFGGGLYGYAFRFIDPTSFYISMLIAILAIVYVGGLASLGGTLAGTFLAILLPELLRFTPFNPEIVGAMRQIIFAAAVLGVILWRPKGIVGKVEL